VFASNINSVGQGHLTSRDDVKLYNTEKEKLILSPVNDHYVKMA
jgi:hypothetical protein